MVESKVRGAEATEKRAQVMGEGSAMVDESRGREYGEVGAMGEGSG